MFSTLHGLGIQNNNEVPLEVVEFRLHKVPQYNCNAMAGTILTLPLTTMN